MYTDEKLPKTMLNNLITMTLAFIYLTISYLKDQKRRK